MPLSKNVSRDLPASDRLAVSSDGLTGNSAMTGAPLPVRSAERDGFALLRQALSTAARCPSLRPRLAAGPRGLKRLWGICCGVLLAVTPGALPSAAAQTASTAHTTDPRGRLASAREEFERGFHLAYEGRWAAALAAYERSERLHPHPLTTYNIALCEQALRRNTRARRAFLRALKESRRGIPMRGKEADAWTRVGAIERELGRLRLTIEPADAAIRIDGRPLEGDVSGGAQGALVAGTLPAGPGRPPPTARFDVLLDAGRHEIELSRPGFVSRRVPWSAAAGATGALTLTLAPTLRAERAQKLFYAGASVAGLGALGLITGTIFGARTLVLKGEADKHCKPRCDADGLETYHKSQASADIATATFFPGLVLAGVGTGVALAADRLRSLWAGSSAEVRVTAIVGQSGSFFALGHAW